MESKNIFYHFASVKRLLTEADKKLLKQLKDSLEKKKILKSPFGECFICQSDRHWANNCPKRIKKENTKMNHQETNPKQDILGEAMKCIYGEDSNLQILLNEITD